MATVSTHSRLKAAGRTNRRPSQSCNVSTHSRLKAAGCLLDGGGNFHFGFNTQPPEGGWKKSIYESTENTGFNTQPPEGGWFHERLYVLSHHSFNTQPPEGGWFNIWGKPVQISYVSTHSRLKAAGCSLSVTADGLIAMFQHTAA